MALANFTARADIQHTSTTTLNFAAALALASRPIVLWALSGRQAVLFALPTAHTISGTAGTRYLYALLAAPSGDPYSTASGGILYKILNALPWNRLNWVNGFRAIHPGDGTHLDAAQTSTVTFVETASATQPDTHHVPLGQFEVTAGAITNVTSYEGQVSVTVSALIHQQCRLIKSGANLVLQPYNGNALVIGGASRPVASPTLSAAALTPDTTYFIYALWSGSAVTLEASTTGHSQHTDGVEIKTGDSTRTFVGMARCVTGPAWVDTATQRFVASYFNRRDVAALNVFTADRSTASTSSVEINTEIRVQFLAWADSAISLVASGNVRTTVGAGSVVTAIGLDGTTMEDGASGRSGGDASNMPVHAAVRKTVTEGYHYGTLLGSISAGTATWEGAASVAPSSLPRCSLQWTGAL